MWLAGREDEYTLSVVPLSPVVDPSDLPSEDFFINSMQKLLLTEYGAVPWSFYPTMVHEQTNLTYADAEWKAFDQIKKSELLCRNHAGVWQPVIGKIHREACAPYLEVSTATACTPDALVSLIRRGQIAAGHLSRRVSTSRYAVRCFNAVSDRKGTKAKSSGMHENYLVSRDFHDRLIPTTAVDELEAKFFCRDWTTVQDLASFEALLTIFIGEGKIGGDIFTPDVPYQISARADFVWQKVGFDTSGMIRPLVNLRDEPHADGARFARLHVINREGNRSWWALKLGIGLHMIFLNALQNGLRLSWHLHNPVAALHTISQDPTLRAEVPVVVRRNRTSESKTVLALFGDILHELAQYLSWAHVPSWCYEILEKAEFLHDHLARGDPEEEAARYLDWKIKEKFLRKYIAQKLQLSADNPASWYNPRCRQIDIKYHQLDDEAVWERIADACNVADFDRFHKPFGEPTEERFWKECPPEDGRSYLMWLVATHPDLKEKIIIHDWESLEYRIPYRFTWGTVPLGDPRLFGKKHLQKLFGDRITIVSEDDFVRFVIQLQETPGTEIPSFLYISAPATTVFGTDLVAESDESCGWPFGHDQSP